MSRDEPFRRHRAVVYLSFVIDTRIAGLKQQQQWGEKHSRDCWRATVNDATRSRELGPGVDFLILITLFNVPHHRFATGAWRLASLDTSTVSLFITPSYCPDRPVTRTF
jgi:hypothetical protein